MDITTALAALITLQSGLAITSPISARVLKAYDFPPDRNVDLPDCPCFVNTWSFDDVEYFINYDANDPPAQKYTVTMQLFVREASTQQGAKIATAFLSQLIRAWDHTLSGTVSDAKLRGSKPTVGMLEWGGSFYPGLNLNAELELYG